MNNLTRYLIIFILILAIIVAGGFLFYRKNSENSKKAENLETQAEIQGSSEEPNSLETQSSDSKKSDPIAFFKNLFSKKEKEEDKRLNFDVGKFISIISNVENFKLDEKIFTDEVFINLKDSSIVLEHNLSDEGRPNPFAPIGVDNVSNEAEEESKEEESKEEGKKKEDNIDKNVESKSDKNSKMNIENIEKETNKTTPIIPKLPQSPQSPKSEEPKSTPSLKPPSSTPISQPKVSNF